MKKIYITIILILLGLTIYLWYQNQKLGSPPLISSKEYVTDTIYLEKKFEPLDSYSTEVKPKGILVYKNQTSFLHDDFHSSDKDTLLIKNAQFSGQDSLLQFSLEKNKLQLNLFNQQTGTYSSRIFPIDLDDYQYIWNQGKLTQKKTKGFQFKPYAYAKYRVFHNLLDMGAGISFKTKKLDYNLGVNAYHYPSYKKGIGMDLEISIVYNF